MFDLRMAGRSLVRGRALTAVMIVALSLGIGTWYAQRRIFAFLAGKAPVARPDVFQVALERGEPGDGERAPVPSWSPVEPRLPSILLTPRDAQGVLAGDPARRQTITFGARALLEPDGAPAEVVRVRYATRDLFALFAIPLAAGEPWPAADDAGLLAGVPGERAVVDEALARRLFGGAAAALGRSLRVDGRAVRVVGVVAARHRDRYHLYERFVVAPDAIYLPLAHATAAGAEPDFTHEVAGGETGSAGVWVELPTAAARAAFVAGAEAYLDRERAAGRATAPRAVTLRSAASWRDTFAPAGTINLWPLLSAMCLVTSIVSLVRMLMTKFAGRAHGLGLLRAFGARRSAVMNQLLLEAVLVGLVAGVVGLAVGVALMPLAAATVEAWQGSVRAFSVSSAVATVAASVLAALGAAAYPAWRLSRGTPAMQLGGAR